MLFVLFAKQIVFISCLFKAVFSVKCFNGIKIRDAKSCFVVINATQFALLILSAFSG